MSLPPHVLESLRTQYRKRADALINLLAHKERLLITILIGNNLVNVLTAAIATKLSLSIAQQS